MRNDSPLPREHPHRFTAQLALFPRPREHTVRCESPSHQRQRRRAAATTTRASWEVRFYTDIARMVALALSGKSDEEIAQTTWEETCHEQDRMGIVVHHVGHYCDPCVLELARHFAGEAPAILQWTAAIVTHQPMVLATERASERVGILGGWPPDLSEEELLRRLDTDEFVAVRTSPPPPSHRTE